jgi:hypothetical protein
MTPAEELQNIDAQIDRLTQEIERLLCERREIINRENLNKGSASALANTNRTPRTSPLC